MIKVVCDCPLRDKVNTRSKAVAKLRAGDTLTVRAVLPNTRAGRVDIEVEVFCHRRGPIIGWVTAGQSGRRPSSVLQLRFVQLAGDSDLPRGALQGAGSPPVARPWF